MSERGNNDETDQGHLFSDVFHGVVDVVCGPSVRNQNEMAERMRYYAREKRDRCACMLECIERIVLTPSFIAFTASRFMPAPSIDMTWRESISAGWYAVVIPASRW